MATRPERRSAGEDRWGGGVKSTIFHIGIGEKAPNRYVKSKAMNLRLPLNQYTSNFVLQARILPKSQTPRI